MRAIESYDGDVEASYYMRHEDAFTEWLDSEAYFRVRLYPDEHENGDRVIEEIIPLDCSYRDLITTLNTQGRYGDAKRGHIAEEMPNELEGHRQAFNTDVRCAGRGGRSPRHVDTGGQGVLVG